MTDINELEAMTGQECWELYMVVNIEDLHEPPTRDDIIENARMFDESLTPEMLKIIIEKCMRYMAEGSKKTA